jgi:hypothetical protein
VLVVRALSAAAAAVVLSVGLVACTGAGEPSGDATTAPSASSTAPADGPTPSGSAGGSTDGKVDVKSDEPIDKVIRAGDTTAPAVSAKPAPTTGTVSYSDGVSLKIAKVTFAEETAKGPGSFPGREYARITLTLKNGSDHAIDLGTVVPTMLDKSGASLPKVYAEEAKVGDFFGSLAPGKTATAVYAFAVPSSARSDVVLVVDFDALHSSAVFRGELS